MFKSQEKPAPRSGAQKTKSAPRHGSPDFCLPTNRDMRLRLFTRAMLGAKSTVVPLLRR
jgi:hypothetical protein